MVLAARRYMKYRDPNIMAHVRIRPCEICCERGVTVEDSSPITWNFPCQFHSTNILISSVSKVMWSQKLAASLVMHCSLLSSGILYCTVQRVTIPDAVIIQFVLLKMGMLMPETCRGL